MSRSIAPASTYLSALLILLSALHSPLVAQDAVAQDASTRATLIEDRGQLVIEAEDFFESRESNYEGYKHQHRWVIDHSISGYSGKGYVRVAPDERGEDGNGPASPRGKQGALLKYRIWVTRPGTYHVFARGFSKGGESNGLHVGLLDQEFSKGPGASNMSGFRPKLQWQWENARKHGYTSPATIQFESGPQTLCVWNRDDGFCLDKLSFVHSELGSSEDCIPTGKGSTAQSTHAIRIRGNQFEIGGSTQSLWGIRTASAAVSDESTADLLAQLDDYRESGINAITVFYMGSSGGHLDPFLPDGSDFRPGEGVAVRNRIDKIVQECDRRGIVVIVGIFYQWKRTALSDRFLQDWSATQEATQTVAKHLAQQTHRNVILNIANEQGSNGYLDEPWGRVREVEDLLSLAKLAKAHAPDLLIGAGGYHHPKNVLIGQSMHVDALLFDTLGPDQQPHSGHWHDHFVGQGIRKPMINVEIFGAWTSQFSPQGVYSETGKSIHREEIQQAINRPGLNIFFHSNPWFQGPSIGAPLRFDLGGQGTPDAPGVRWFFDAVSDKTP